MTTVIVPVETLGERICRLRAAAGFSLREMGVRVGRQPTTLNAIEHDRADPRLSTLYAVAQALQVELWDLLEGVRRR